MSDSRYLLQPRCPADPSVPAGPCIGLTAPWSSQPMRSSSFVFAFASVVSASCFPGAVRSVLSTRVRVLR